MGSCRTSTLSLPIFHTEDKNISLLQTNWAAQLNPIIQLPLSNSILLPLISLSMGDNVINHRLGRNLQGWIVTRMENAFVELFDKQSTNQMKDKTLILNSSAVGLIDLIVF